MSKDPNAPTSSLLAISEQAGKVLAILAGGLLVLSTSYDFSFLCALGLSFEDVPSSLADHVRSAIVWAPHATIYVLAFSMYEMLMRRIEDGLSEEELIQQSSNPKFTRIFRRSPQVLFAIAAVLVFFMSILFTASNHALFLAGICIWGVLSIEIVKHPRMGTKFDMTNKRLFVALPIIVMWVGSLGYGRGESMLLTTTPQWSAEMKVGEKVERRQLFGIRRFSTAAIVVAADRRVFILPSESILSAELIRSPNADLPRICRWFGTMCPPTKKTNQAPP